MEDEKSYNHLIGLEVEQAKVELEKEGKILRVDTKDGVPLVGTCDMKANRLNVAITKGIITSVSGLG